jgi:hypothetical protein
MEDKLWAAANVCMLLRGAVPRIAARFPFPQVSPVPGYGQERIPPETLHPSPLLHRHDILADHSVTVALSRMPNLAVRVEKLAVLARMNPLAAGTECMESRL